MSIFSTILGKIFGGSSAHASTPAATAATPAAAPGATPATPPAAQVDVSAVLDGLASKSSEKLNWKTSIVDLLKLLGIDSSLANRTALAKELGFTGNTSDSAAMNIWLHRQVMNKLAANGGQVPAELKD